MIIIPTSDIFEMRNRLKMAIIDTTTDTAEMIEFFTLRDRPNKMLIRENVCKAYFGTTIPTAKNSVAFCIRMPGPQPAALGRLLYEVKKSINSRAKTSKTRQFPLQTATTLRVSRA